MNALILGHNSLYCIGYIQLYLLFLENYDSVI